LRHAELRHDELLRAELHDVVLRRLRQRHPGVVGRVLLMLVVEHFGPDAGQPAAGSGRRAGSAAASRPARQIGRVALESEAVPLTDTLPK
jgi:hypothetical protein